MAKRINSKKKAQLGQFFTPASIAGFMADMFIPGNEDHCHLLDAGAGIGALSTAFLDRWISGGFEFKSVELDAFEVDTSLQPLLKEVYKEYQAISGFISSVRITDFIVVASEWLSGDLFAESLPKYSHAILNPPYKKIRSDSVHRSMLRRAGIETVNLYSAFVALALALLKDRGQLVAIIPRSFCNGPYYRPFRKYILNRAAIRQIHLFESRNKAFKEDDVLQENVIIHLERCVKQGNVIISTSTDDKFEDLTKQEFPYDRILLPNDAEQFIHIPTSREMNFLEKCPDICHSLEDLNLCVSTGPVVDFRVKQHLCEMPESDTVPLLYPIHFNGKGIEWPKRAIKKPNAIRRNSETEKWLYPNGFYCIVRRFSTKEEKRRVVANIVEPSSFPNIPALGFENHLNVFHDNRRGLNRYLALGLSVFLNTTGVDQYFRTFNGHTQVNATDLKLLKYPKRDILVSLGKWAAEQGELSQQLIDKKMETIVE